MRNYLLFIIFFIHSICSQLCYAQDRRPPYQYPADPEVLQKVKEWQDLKFGLFMHWGPYSQWGVLESWTLCPEDHAWITRPKDQSYFQYVAAYENLSTTFNPVKFDPDKWSRAAKEAGMKYVVFTTKHHDGFNMYDTRQSEYKITGKACPFSSDLKADITKGIFESFRKENFMIGAYYSITDWHHSDFWWNYFPPVDRNINYSPSKYPEKWDRYNNFMYNQLEEIVSGYGNLDLLWFDLIGISKEREVDWKRFATMVRGHQPGIMMVARGANNQYENYRTPEQEVPAEALDYPWETCMTMGDQWSYKPNDNYKSAYQLIQTLVRIVSKGGNLLLNIGPGPDGDFDPIAYERLNEIGAWMNINSEAIYGTKIMKPYQERKIAFTKKDNSVYAIYLPDEDEKSLPGTVQISSVQPITNSKIYLLGYKKALRWKKTREGIIIIIPSELQSNPPCHYAWTFKINSNVVTIPKPEIVVPGIGTAAPSDAIVLFDGADFSQWRDEKNEEVKWKIENGAMSVVKGTGSIYTKQSFGDCQLHIEWKSPETIVGTGQERGNSGVIFQERYELQVLDSYNNSTYYDGQAGSIYNQSAPLVNASRKPGEWQTYDVVFMAPRYRSNGELETPPHITVFHNGVLIQNNFEIKGVSMPYVTYDAYCNGPLQLQDHGNPVSYRNIWIREL